MDHSIQRRKLELSSKNWSKRMEQEIHNECEEFLSGCCGAPEIEGTGCCGGCRDRAGFECPVCEFGTEEEMAKEREEMWKAAKERREVE